MSEQQEPRREEDSNFTIAIAGVITVIATIAVLYISGTIYIPNLKGGEVTAPSNGTHPGWG